MAVLTYGQRKKIESHIRNYHRYMDEIAEWREAAAAGPPKDARSRKSGKRRSDPTASAAVRLASPPKHVRDMELWMEAVDAVRRRYEREDKGRLFDAWYWKPPRSVRAVALSIGVSEKQFYNWLNEIVIHVALLAAQKGIFIFAE